LLERFTKFARSRLHLVEQPRILDRNDRLVGEGFGKTNLLLGKRLNDGAL
jgi:hypothetical protein